MIRTVPQDLFSRFFLLRLAAALIAAPAAADDIGAELRRGQRADSANYLELGLGLQASSGPKAHGFKSRERGLLAILNGRFEWQGLFVENFSGDSNGLVLGYGLVERPDWSLDLLLTAKHFGRRHQDAWHALDTRTDRVAGLRLSTQTGDYVWQWNAWKDVSGHHDGWGASAQLGRSWQLGNWNLHALAGLSYGSAKVLDYYHGVSATQAAATGLSAYRAGGGLGWAVEVGASYPLARDWVLRSSLHSGRAPAAVADSPRWREPQAQASRVVLSISHVF